MYLVMTIHDNIPRDLVLLTSDRKKAMERFLKICDEHAIAAGKKLDDVEREWFLNDGYMETTNGSVTYLDLTNAETDDLPSENKVVNALKAARSCIETPGDLSEEEVGHVIEDIGIAIAELGYKDE